MRTTFERIDLKQYDGHTTGPWEVDPTPETQSGGDFQARILARRAFDDGADAVITGFPLHGNRNDYSNIHFEPNARLIAAAPDLLAALRAAYAEIDRLRAYALDWKIVTDDPATLPEEDRLCLVRFTEDPEDHERTTVCDSYGPRSFDNEDDWPHWRMVDTPYDAFSIFPGDRWTYIPEAPKADEVPA